MQTAVKYMPAARVVYDQRPILAIESSRILNDLMAEHGRLDSSVNERFRRTSLEDFDSHLAFLAESLQVDDPTSWLSYLDWILSVSSSRNLPHSDVGLMLESLRQACRSRLSSSVLIPVSELLDLGVSRIDEFGDGSEPREPSLPPLATEFLGLLLDGRRRQAVDSIRSAFEDGVSLRDLYLDVFQPALVEVGRLWQINEVTVAQEHYCTAATQLALSQVYMLLPSSERRGRRLVVACASQNLHEIGARMVADFFELDGWDTYYLGADTPAESVLDSVRSQTADLVALSVSLRSQVDEARHLIAAMRADDDFAQVKIMVGGPPFALDPALADTIGADLSAASADHAIEIANRAMLERDREGSE